MRGAISEYEKEKIKERTVRGKRGKAQKGKIVQNARPFGYDWNSATCLYEINEEEAKTVRLIYDLCINHGLGVHDIFLELKRLGIKISRKNKQGDIDSRFMHPKTVYNILTKTMYYGRYEQFRQVTKKIGQKKRNVPENEAENRVIIQIPAIVSYETFTQAQQQLQQNKTLAGRRNTRADYLLKGAVILPTV